MSADTSTTAKKDYQKLVDFMKRVSLNGERQGGDFEIGSANQEFLVPRLTPSTESCKLELPDGRSVELPLLEGTEGPRSIDGRQFY